MFMRDSPPMKIVDMPVPDGAPSPVYRVALRRGAVRGPQW